MALDDPSLSVRTAPFVGGSPSLGSEHFDRVAARAEPGQVEAAAMLPGWTPTHTAKVGKRPEIVLKDLAAKLEASAFLKSEPDMSKAEAPASAYFSRGDLDGLRRAASFFGTEAPDHEERLRHAMWEHDGDEEKAALASHGAEPTDDNLRALRGVRKLTQEERREEADEVDQKIDVKATFPESEETAKGVRNALAAHFVARVDLPGINSQGSLVARDEANKRSWLLKKGRPRAEAAYWKVADRWGMGIWIAKSELLTFGAEERVAIELLPWKWKSMEDLHQADPGGPAKLLAPFLAAGILHRLAAIDYVLGNGDRNANNILVDPEKLRFRLIDEGNALELTFDPATDRRSYTPFYLRAWAPQGPFNTLTPDEKLKALPLLPPGPDEELKAWLLGMDAEGMAEDLKRYGFDPAPSLDRLARLKAVVQAGSAAAAVNRVWVGT